MLLVLDETTLRRGFQLQNGLDRFRNVPIVRESADGAQMKEWVLDQKLHFLAIGKRSTLDMYDIGEGEDGPPNGRGHPVRV